MLTVCLAARVALADGCYIPAQAVRKVPAIPAQRAVVAWKDGVETLVVSSALDSEAQQLGWIIPLPGVPEDMAQETPGALKTLNFCLQPRITHELSPGLGWAIFAVFICNLVLGVFLFKRKEFLGLLGLLAALALFAAIIMPALGTAGSSSATGSNAVLVEKTAKVGAYDIKILRVKTAQDLDEWLAANGLAVLPAAARQPVADYIGNGWVFAAIRLTRAEAGANTPHPVRLMFKTPAPVYPMKLTAAGGGRTRVELFVIANQRASAELLREEFCDRFIKTNEPARGDHYETGDVCKGQGTELAIKHPSLCRWMWDGCVLTKLSGTISAARMVDDIHFQWKPFRPYREHLYTLRGARESALTLFVWILGGLLFVSMLGCKHRLRQPGGVAWYFRRAFAPILALAVLVGVTFFAVVPKLRWSETHVTDALLQWRFPQYLLAQASALVYDHPEWRQGTAGSVADHLLENIRFEVGREVREATPRSRARNEITGADLEVEDSPGNFTVEVQPAKVIIRTYDRTGRPLISEFPNEPGAGVRGAGVAQGSVLKITNNVISRRTEYGAARRWR